MEIGGEQTPFVVEPIEDPVSADGTAAADDDVDVEVGETTELVPVGRA